MSNDTSSSNPASAALSSSALHYSQGVKKSMTPCYRAIRANYEGHLPDLKTFVRCVSSLFLSAGPSAMPARFVMINKYICRVLITSWSVPRPGHSTTSGSRLTEAGTRKVFPDLVQWKLPKVSIACPIRLNQARLQATPSCRDLSGFKETLRYGKWERPLEALPSAAKWPAWGKLREEMLAATKELIIIWSEILGNDFLDELFGAPRPQLAMPDKFGGEGAGTFGAPGLQIAIKICSLTEYSSIDNICGYFLLSTFKLCSDSDSLQEITLVRSYALKKVLLETRTLKKLILTTCPLLDTLMVWSNDLATLDLLDCKEITILKLYCPRLENLEKNDLKDIRVRSNFAASVPSMEEVPSTFAASVPSVEVPSISVPPVPSPDSQKSALAPKLGYPSAKKHALQITRPMVPRTHLFGF